jgi:hypothetical protein
VLFSGAGCCRFFFPGVGFFWFFRLTFVVFCDTIYVNKRMEDMDMSHVRGRVVSVAEGRSLVASGFCLFWGFAWVGGSAFAVLVQGRGPGFAVVRLGSPGRPLPGVRGPARAFVFSRPARRGLFASGLWAARRPGVGLRGSAA